MKVKQWLKTCGLLTLSGASLIVPTVALINSSSIVQNNHLTINKTEEDYSQYFDFFQANDLNCISPKEERGQETSWPETMIVPSYMTDEHGEKHQIDCYYSNNDNSLIKGVKHLQFANDCQINYLVLGFNALLPLESIDIPSSITYISSFSLIHLPNLKSVSFHWNEAQLTPIINQIKNPEKNKFNLLYWTGLFGYWPNTHVLPTDVKNLTIYTPKDETGTLTKLYQDNFQGCIWEFPSGGGQPNPIQGVGLDPSTTNWQFIPDPTPPPSNLTPWAYIMAGVFGGIMLIGGLSWLFIEITKRNKDKKAEK